MAHLGPAAAALSERALDFDQSESDVLAEPDVGNRPNRSSVRTQDSGDVDVG